MKLKDIRIGSNVYIKKSSFIPYIDKNISYVVKDIYRKNKQIIVELLNGVN